MGIEIKITEQCNLRCSYCYYECQTEQRTMSWEKLRSVIDFFYNSPDFKKQKPLPITFFGGEPLLYPNLIKQAVDYCDSLPENPFTYYINTNGTLLTNDLLDWMDSHKVSLFLSLDGGQTAHDLNRFSHFNWGSFERIEPFLPRLAARDTLIEKVICANTVKETFSAVREILGYGFKRIVSVPDFSSEWTPDHLNHLKSQYIKLAEFYKAEKQMGRSFHFSMFDSKIEMIKTGDSYRNHSCNLGKKHFVLSPDGSIYPCTRFAVNKADNPYRMGSSDTGIDAKQLKLFKKHRTQDKAPCRKCEIKKFCLGNSCDCISFSLGGDISYVSPLVCEHERMLFGVVQDYLL